MPLSSPNSPDGTLIVISGPSGVGKSTVVRTLARLVPFHFSVSATTRRPRASERDGIDYFFMDAEEFRQLIRSEELLEWAEYSEHLYGTPRAPVLAKLQEGCHVLLDIENQGAMQVKKAYPDAVAIFIAPPSMASLEERLRNRADTSEAEIALRLGVAAAQLESARRDYDHVVINNDLEGAVAAIVRIIEDPQRAK